MGRHFLKDGLARIAYANPDMKIDVQKKDKTREENWDPMMVIELGARHVLLIIPKLPVLILIL